MHGTSAGILDLGYAHAVWMTDADMKALLRDQIRARQVSEPVDLEHLAARLQDLKKSADARTIIPVDVGGHWVMMAVTIVDHQLTHVSVQDSMASAPYEVALRAIITADQPGASFAISCTGQQTDGWSCGHRTVQAILKALNPQHAIARATTLPALTTAIERSLGFTPPAPPLTLTRSVAATPAEAAIHDAGIDTALLKTMAAEAKVSVGSPDAFESIVKAQKKALDHYAELKRQFDASSATRPSTAQAPATPFAAAHQAGKRTQRAVADIPLVC